MRASGYLWMVYANTRRGDLTKNTVLSNDIIYVLAFWSDWLKIIVVFCWHTKFLLCFAITEGAVSSNARFALTRRNFQLAKMGWLQHAKQRVKLHEKRHAELEVAQKWKLMSKSIFLFFDFNKDASRVLLLPAVVCFQPTSPQWAEKMCIVRFNGATSYNFIEMVHINIACILYAVATLSRKQNMEVITYLGRP